MSGKVIQIFVCPTKGRPMEEVTEVRASREAGLEGDRYGLGKGAWSTPDNITSRHVSLIAHEAIEKANREFSEPFLPSETRRNIVTSGVDLNSLVDKEFSIGQTRLRGTELCDPCTRPAILAGKGSAVGKVFAAAFDNQGGLYAEVITDGLIRVGDSIVYD